MTCSGLALLVAMQLLQVQASIQAACYGCGELRAASVSRPSADSKSSAQNKSILLVPTLSAPGQAFVSADAVVQEDGDDKNTGYL